MCSLFFLSVRCWSSGLSRLGAEVPGRAPWGPTGVRGVLQRAASSGPAADEPPPAASDRRQSRAGLPEAAPPTPRTPPQTAARDARRQGLKGSWRRPNPAPRQQTAKTVEQGGRMRLYSCFFVHWMLKTSSASFPPNCKGKKFKKVWLNWDQFLDPVSFRIWSQVKDLQLSSLSYSQYVFTSNILHIQANSLHTPLERNCCLKPFCFTDITEMQMYGSLLMPKKDI